MILRYKSKKKNKRKKNKENLVVTVNPPINVSIVYITALIN